MKQGSTLQALAAKLADIRDNQKDIVVRPEALDKVTAIVVDAMRPAAGAISVEDVLVETEAKIKASDKGRVAINIRNGHDRNFAPTSHAQSQLGNYAKVPTEYLRRISEENPVLAADALNHGFAAARLDREETRKGGRLLRAHGGNLRAFLSSSYGIMDNFDLAEIALPHLVDGKFHMESQELTERRMYLKAVSPKMEGEVVLGSPIQYGIVISNSDVGAGSARFEPFIKILACTNGMIRSHVFKKVHLGKDLLGQEGVSDLVLQDSTKRKINEAFLATVSDVMGQFANEDFFRKELLLLQDAAKIRITNFNLPDIIERTAERVKLNLGETAKMSILDNLASGAHGAGMNKWGLANAFTYAAEHGGMDYDAATELERVGGKILELDNKSWEYINAK